MSLVVDVRHTGTVPDVRSHNTRTYTSFARELPLAALCCTIVAIPHVGCVSSPSFGNWLVVCFGFVRSALG